MSSRDGNPGAQSKLGKIPRNVIEFLMICLVDNEADLFGCLTELLGDRLVDRRQTFTRINEKEDNVSSVHCDLRFGRYRLGEVCISEGSEASGIHKVAWDTGEIAWGRDPVAGDSGLVMHDGNGATCQPVEESGLSHIGTSYEGDYGFTDATVH